ncbi:MAG: hypothetical protein KAQ90_02560, partial [Melioribacteraceae bacterium]|nr:hypothetical protein [Melioribacteraceae bacterium]
MLNYVWFGLIILGIATALTTDITEQVNNKYRNGDPLPIEIQFDESFNLDESKSYDATIKVNA